MANIATILDAMAYHSRTQPAYPPACVCKDVFAREFMALLDLEGVPARRREAILLLSTALTALRQEAKIG